jgi:glycosyltransferase involved in cell wall biosynthesis
MKILILADGMYPFVLGGMQKHSYSLAKSLNLHGIHVYVIHYYHDNSDGNIVNHPEFEVFDKNTASFSAIPFPKFKKIPGHYLRANLKFSLEAWNKIKSEIGNYDLIYSQGFTGFHFIKMKLQGKHNVPIWVNFHGFEMFQKSPDFFTGLKHHLFRNKVKWICRNTDIVLSYGGKISSLVRTLGVKENKIIESPMGIDDSWFKTNHPINSNNEKIKFIFVGRYEKRKGIDELNLALNNLLIDGKKYEFEFHFIGPIPDSKKIQDKRLIYHGSISNQNKISEILRQCDVLVCPSHSEGMPTVILEGMVCGCAIIATDVGAVSLELKENGWLLPKPEPKIIEEAIIEAIENKSQVAIMKEKSLIHVENFKWSKIASQLIEKIKKTKN